MSHSHNSSDAADPPSTGGAEAPSPLSVVVLAAGQGTRMRSATHKVLHPLAGRPLIHHVLELAGSVGAQDAVVVLGHLAEQVRSALPEGVRTVIQEPQRGTGHAVQVAADLLRQRPSQRVLVLYGDVALLRPESLGRLVEQPLGPDTPMAFMSAVLPNSTGYGRVIRDGDGTVSALVEEAEATPEQKAIREVHGGPAVFWSDWLWSTIWDLPEQSKGEFYLTDMVNMAASQGKRVLAVPVADLDEIHGVNDRAQLAQAHRILWQRTADSLMKAGVTLLDPERTYVEPGVTVEADAVLHPGTVLRGATRIAAGCEVGPDTEIVDSTVGPRSRVWRSVLEGATVGADVSIGPFSHLRPGAVLLDHVHLGNYAEVKNSTLGPGVAMHHFSYVGDATLGANVNVGAGTITCNFDGQRKWPTTVGDGVFIGSDTMLVAPVTLGDGARTGAGAVVNRDVPAGETVVGVPAKPLRKGSAGTGGEGDTHGA